MLNSISSAGLYYSSPYAGPFHRVQTEPSAQKMVDVETGQRAANPECPVLPVRPVAAVSGSGTESWRPGSFRKPEFHAAETAVRMRIQYVGAASSESYALEGGQEGTAVQDRMNAGQLLWPGADASEMAVRMRIQYADSNAFQAQGTAGTGQTEEDGTCETCEKRKYKDRSDDMGVSFKTPAGIKPDQAALKVRGHEMEHVVRERAKAEREDRKVVSQSVTLHTNICPECGKAYISGGTTSTVTMAKSDGQNLAGQESAPALTAA